MAGKKGLSFLTVISTVICVVFVCEAAAPAAAIGNSQFFWWIFLILTFLVPYGLAVAELGTTYDSEGGIIDWIRDGLGDRWAARAAYYYWINYPFWIASLATIFPTVLGLVFALCCLDKVFPMAEFLVFAKYLPPSVEPFANAKPK